MRATNIDDVSASSTLIPYTPSSQIPDFFYYPLYIGHFFCTPAYQTDRNRYDSFLLLYTKSGHGYVKVDDKELELHAGDVCLLDCYKPHYYCARTSWEIMWVHFDGGASRQFFEYLTDEPFFHTFFNNPLTYEQSWMQLYDLFLRQAKVPEVALSQYIHQLLTLLALNKTTGSSGYKANADFIDETLKYIHRHLSADLNVEELASRVSLSPFYFSRKFKEEVGYSPYQYILTSRINLAKFHLKSSQDTVKNIGFSCGFKSEHSFCTAFKNETGMTPSDYRKH